MNPRRLRTSCTFTGTRSWTSGCIDLRLDALLLLFALLLRGAVLVLAPEALATDPDGYRLLARNLVEHGTFGFGDVPTAYRPPLYPLMLAAWAALEPSTRVAIGALHLVLGVAAVGLTAEVGRRWGLGRYRLLAAALVACDPILLHQSTLVMTETPAALLAVGVLLALTLAAERPALPRFALAGALAGLAVLCRPTFLVPAVLAALVLPWFAASGERPRWRSGRRNVEEEGNATEGERRNATEGVPYRWLAYGAALAVVLSPWAVRNQVLFGRPIVGTTHGGYTLLLGNNPGFYEYLRNGAWGSTWDASQFNDAWARQAPLAGPAAELANDRRAYAEAWRHITAEPGSFFYACLIRIGRLWQPLPHRTAVVEGRAARWSRYVAGAWYAVELPLAALGVVVLLVAVRGQKQERRAPPDLRQIVLRTWFWGLLLAASFTAVHAFYWTNMRMRAPLMPVAALAAALAVASIGKRRLLCNLLAEK